MPPGCRDGERTFHMGLALHIGEVRCVVLRYFKEMLKVGCVGRDGQGTGKECSSIPDIRNGDDLDLVDHTRFLRIELGQDNSGIALVPCEEGHGQRTGYGTESAIQGKFAYEEIIPKQIPCKLVCRSEDTHGDGKIVEGTALGDVCRGEIDDHTSPWRTKTRIANGCGNPFLGFFHGSIGQAHDLDFL